jgi:hypothetical protein
MPRKKRPHIARLDQVRISRNGEEAIVECLDFAVATTHLRIGPQVQGMMDEKILLVSNQVIAAQIRNRDELGEYVAVEIPPGNPQVERHPGTVSRSRVILPILPFSRLPDRTAIWARPRYHAAR